MLNLSVNCWAGAFCCCASLMSVMIFCSELSAAGRATVTSTAPHKLMVPASTMSPTFLATGDASPVRFDSSAAVWPLANSASTGNCGRCLAKGESRIRLLAVYQAHRSYKFRHGAQALDFREEDHFSEKDTLVLERFALMATVAAREAVAQSGISFTGDLADHSGVITGTSVGGQFSEEQGYIRLYREKQPKVAPLTIPRMMSNAGASRISLEFGIHEPSYTVSTA